jgi:hypothetical protein
MPHRQGGFFVVLSRITPGATTAVERVMKTDVTLSKMLRYNPADNAMRLMKYSYRTRFVTVVVALFSLLFMQLAVAAYACPNPAADEQHAVMLDGAGQPMKNCPGLDKQSPSLCQAHAQPAPQSLDKPPPPAVQPFAPIGLFVLVLTPVEPAGNAIAPAATFLRASGTSPPISIRNCCFRL